MELSVVTVLKSGQHLSLWQEVDSDSIEDVTEGPLARYIAEMMRWYPDDRIDRFVVVAGSLSWSINVSLGQDLLYRPAPQFAKKSALQDSAVFGPAPRKGKRQ